MPKLSIDVENYTTKFVTQRNETTYIELWGQASIVEISFPTCLVTNGLLSRIKDLELESQRAKEVVVESCNSLRKQLLREELFLELEIID